MLFRSISIFITFCVILSSAQTDPIDFLRKKELENQEPSAASLLSIPRPLTNNKLLLDYNYRSNPSTQFSPFTTGFDENLDESKYIVGTGDGFSIYLWGTLNTQLNSVVNMEGDLVIQDVGVVKLKGKTLKESKDIIKSKIFEHYKKIDVTIILNKVRDFKVYVLGEVQQPGAYIVDGTTRVSDLIQLAGGINDSGSYRKIVISNSSDSTKDTADLTLFFKCNIITKNPYLKEGSRIFVSKVKEKIQITGAVNYPGEYDFMDGDSLLNLLTLSGGLSRGADSCRIIVKRFINNSDSLNTIICSFKDHSVESFLLNRDDRVIVTSLPDYRVFRNVTIKGEVQYPGVYPIQKDKTTLREIIEMAGGLTQDANLRSSVIKRKNDMKISTRELERLKKLPPDLLSPMEKSYVLARSTDGENIVNLNIKNKNDNEFSNIILRDGDEISIESKSLSVKIIGGVVAPGLVEYNEGATLSFYIARAGGYNDNAKRSLVKIMKYGTEAWTKASTVKKIEPGDVIWVPEKTYHNGLTFTKEMLVLLGSVATIIVSVLSIDQFINSHSNSN